MAITIMKLATCISYYWLTKHFSLCRSMAREAIQEVCLAIQDILANHFILTCRRWSPASTA